MKSKSFIILLLAIMMIMISIFQSLLTKNDALILPGKEKIEKNLVHYQCDNGKEITVNYLHKEDNTLAVISIEKNKTLIFSETISASGSAYRAKQYLWHEKNRQGLLENMLTKEITRCSEK